MLFRSKFTSNEEKRLVTGPLMIPDSMIFRRDEKFGEYYVTYTAETIKKIAEKFMQNQYIANVNTEHKTPIDQVFMVESFITDGDRGISAPKGFEDCPEGTWFGTYKVNNEDVWSQVKDGTFKGFSVEGAFAHRKLQNVEQSDIEKIHLHIDPYVKSLADFFSMDQIKTDTVHLEKNNFKVEIGNKEYFIEFKNEYRGHGLREQAIYFEKLLISGKKDGELLPISETISIMETMDEIRNQIGLKYPSLED